MSPEDTEKRAHLRVWTRHIYRGDGKATADMFVSCPDKGRSVGVEECLNCREWTGLFVEPKEHASYLECTPKHTEEAKSGESSSRATPISAIMTPSVVCVGQDLGVQAVLQIFLERNISGAPVVDNDGKPVGIISKTDLLRVKDLEIDADDLDAVVSTVGAVMTPLVFALKGSDPILRAARLMSTEGVHRLVVVAEDGEVIGILSALDLVRWMAEQEEEPEAA